MLSDADRALLDFAGRWYRWEGQRDAALDRGLGLTPTRYAQRLNALLDDPAALAYAPVVVNRLRRVREQRRRGARRGVA